MTDEELAQLRAQAKNARGMFSVRELIPAAPNAATGAEWAVHFADMTVRLLDEVERMRPIVHAVAAGWSNALGVRIGESASEGRELRKQARAILGIDQ